MRLDLQSIYDNDAFLFNFWTLQTCESIVKRANRWMHFDIRDVSLFGDAIGESDYS